MQNYQSKLSVDNKISSRVIFIVSDGFSLWLNKIIFFNYYTIYLIVKSIFHF